MRLKLINYEQLILTDVAFKEERLKIYPPFITSDNRVLTTGEWIDALQQKVIPVTNRPKNKLIAVRQLSPWINLSNIDYIIRTKIPLKIKLTLVNAINLALEDILSREKNYRLYCYGIEEHIRGSLRLIELYRKQIITGKFRPCSLIYYILYEVLNYCPVCSHPLNIVSPNRLICTSGHVVHIPRKLLNRCFSKENIHSIYITLIKSNLYRKNTDHKEVNHECVLQ